jgi:hypothetical protein
VLRVSFEIPSDILNKINVQFIDISGTSEGKVESKISDLEATSIKGNS